MFVGYIRSVLKNAFWLDWVGKGIEPEGVCFTVCSFVWCSSIALCSAFCMHVWLYMLRCTKTYGKLWTKYLAIFWLKLDRFLIAFLLLCLCYAVNNIGVLKVYLPFKHGLITPWYDCNFNVLDITGSCQWEKKSVDRDVMIRSSWRCWYPEMCPLTPQNFVSIRS